MTTIKATKFYGPCSDFYPSSLGLWQNIYAFIIKLSGTLRFLLVESPVQSKNKNVQFLAFCIRDHLPIKRPRKPFVVLMQGLQSR